MGKCTPITQKAKSSPFPSDANLIEGARLLGESTQRGDYGAMIEDRFNQGYLAKKDNLITSFTPPDDNPPTDDPEEENNGDDPNTQSDSAPEPEE